MNQPWMHKTEKYVEFNPGDLEHCRVNIGTNQTVTIDKLYGSLAALDVRIRLEYTGDVADWVVETQKLIRDPDGGSHTIWVEKARWDCQEDWPEEDP